MVTLTAPAGAGKTTLLAALAAHPPLAGRTAWLTLDRHDRTATRVWDGVLAALVTAGSLTPDHPLAQLRAPLDGMDAGFLAVWSRAMAGPHLPVWLVLDDVHVLSEPAAVDAVVDLASHLPEGVRLLLSGRSELPLHDRRGPLPPAATPPAALRVDDLSFDAEEVDQLLAMEGLDLSPDQRDRLRTVTEGWAAGLRLAIDGLAAATDRDAFLTGFDGGDRTVADYLAVELLERLPAELLTFLTDTSVASALPEALAVELSQREDAPEVLRRLVDELALIQRAGAGADGVRYHELLRTYLEAELRRQDLGRWRRQHVRAARWYLADGATVTALQHAVAAGEAEPAEEILRRAGLRALLDGDGAQLGALIARLPGPVRGAPVPQLLLAARALAVDDPATAELHLETVPAELLAGDPWATALRAVLVLQHARATGDRPAVPGALTAVLATDAGASGDLDLDLFAVEQRGPARLALGQVREGVADLRAARAMARAAGRTAIELAATSRLAAMAAVEGDADTAHRYAREAVTAAEPLGWGEGLVVAHARLTLAHAAYLQVETEPLLEHARRLALTAERAPNPDVRLAARVLRAIASVEAGTPLRPAIAALEGAWSEAASTGVHAALLLSTWGPVHAQLCVRAGDRDGHVRILDRLRMLAPAAPETVLVEVLLQRSLGRPGRALERLRPALHRDLAPLVTLTDVSLRVTAAELAAEAGECREAEELLGEAVVLAAPGGLRRPFVHLAPGLRAALVELGTGEPATARFLDRVLELPAAAGPGLRTAPPLTPTELEMLRELPSLRTVAEIAAARHLSANTVKSHLRAIYRKLEVNGRRQAVEVARRDGLL